MRFARSVWASAALLSVISADSGDTVSLPDLPYAYDALEPSISKEIMTIHHQTHHNGYTKNTNKFITEGTSTFNRGHLRTGFQALVRQVSHFNEDAGPVSDDAKDGDGMNVYRASYVGHILAWLDKRIGRQRRYRRDKGGRALLENLKFNIGGYVNHALFWNTLKPAGESDGPSGALQRAIENGKWDGEGSSKLDQFQGEFSAKTTGVKGSGWGWLCINQHSGDLNIITLPNQDPPSFPHFCILGVDIWEHAFYLDYQADKKQYMENIWKIINWELVGKRYEFFMRVLGHGYKNGGGDDDDADDGTDGTDGGDQIVDGTQNDTTAEDTIGSTQDSPQDTTQEEAY